jgi:hypothetical protein
MASTSLFGRRIHISGSVIKDLAIASTADVELSRELVATLVKELVKRGANFVIPVDSEPKREDGLPICFDWLVWKTIKDNLLHRPQNAPGPFVVAVQHHKTEEQIPAEYLDLWDELRVSQLIKIENAAYWNMNSKRLEAQARFGDVLIALGGDEGVLFLANLYHDADKPIVPLNLPLCAESKGARRVYSYGLASDQSHRLFRIADEGDAHDWINRIGFPKRQSIPDRVSALIGLLESLERPKAFAVRLLNQDHEDYKNVQEFFDIIVKPFLENELGYRLIVIDGNQSYDHARIDQEIFAKLHRSSLVIADLTGVRPNCFLELGYALGRGLPTIVAAREGATLPFDITTFAVHHWRVTGSIDDRRRAFRDHWNAVRNRPTLVPIDPLIS